MGRERIARTQDTLHESLGNMVGADGRRMRVVTWIEGIDSRFAQAVEDISSVLAMVYESGGGADVRSGDLPVRCEAAGRVDERVRLPWVVWRWGGHDDGGTFGSEELACLAEGC